MILHVAVDFKELIRCKWGRTYPWKRPQSCPCCDGGLWGHGWVTIYLEEVPRQVWIRRFRCPRCTVVIRMRPLAYWPRFFYRIETIRSVLTHRFSKRHWPGGFYRQVGGHWIRALVSQVQKRLGLNTLIFANGYEELIRQGWVPVTRSIWGVRIPQLC